MGWFSDCHQIHISIAINIYIYVHASVDCFVCHWFILLIIARAKKFASRNVIVDVVLAAYIGSVFPHVMLFVVLPKNPHTRELISSQKMSCDAQQQRPESPSQWPVWHASKCIRSVSHDKQAQKKTTYLRGMLEYSLYLLVMRRMAGGSYQRGSSFNDSGLHLLILTPCYVPSVHPWLVCVCVCVCVCVWVCVCGVCMRNTMLLL